MYYIYIYIYSTIMKFKLIWKMWILPNDNLQVFFSIVIILFTFIARNIKKSIIHEK